MRAILSASWLLLLVAACPKEQLPPAQAPVADAPSEAPPIASDGTQKHAPSTDYEVQASGETIYMWGGLYKDEALKAPVPLTQGVLHPKQPLELVSVHCLIKGQKAKASVRCSATGRKELPHRSKQSRERLSACTQMKLRSPKRAELKAIEKSWKALLATENWEKRGLSWNLSRWEPPSISGGHAVYEIIVRQEWRGPETKSGGCENPPPNTGCDPYTIETGRMTTLSWEGVTYSYSKAPNAELRTFFGGRAPPLSRMRIGHRNDHGVVQDDAEFKVKGAKDGIDEYRKRQLAAFDRFERKHELSPTVLAALHINRAVTALHLKDLKLLRKEVDALEALAKRKKLDREALELDKELAVFERVLAGEWLLEDPCG